MNKNVAAGLLFFVALLFVAAQLRHKTHVRDTDTGDVLTRVPGYASQQLNSKPVSARLVRRRTPEVTVDPPQLARLSRRMGKMDTALQRLWCLTQQVMSTGGFCVTQEHIFTGGNEFFDPMLCTFIEQLVGNSSIADLGAGVGYYGMCFLRRTKSPFHLKETQTKIFMNRFHQYMGDSIHNPREIYSWHGFDGAFNIDTLSSGFIQYADLSVEGLWLGRRWDWVMSIEVGEHIAADKEDFFLDNLVRHACKGIILSWALPGQIGHKHINNHHNAYIISKIVDRGFINEAEVQAQLKEYISNYNFKNTLMLFQRRQPTDCLTE